MIVHGGDVWGLGNVDVAVRGERISDVGSDLPADENVIDARGCVVLPALVDGHCHLDKTLIGTGWIGHEAGDSLRERMRHDRTRRLELGLPKAEFVRELLGRMVAYGTAHVRTHTDVDPEVGLRGIETVGEVASSFARLVTVQQVAFPQHGLLRLPGTEALLDAALRSGAEVVGSVDPAGIDGDPVQHLDIIFGLADKYHGRLDIHLHDPGSLGIWELGLIAERTRALGLGGRVTVSHAYALGQADAAEQARTLNLLHDAGVHLMTAAVYSFPVPPIKATRDAQVTLGCGHDGICDLWGPYGSGDMLDRAMHLAYRSTLRRDEDIELALHAATYGNAEILGVDDYGIRAGARADLVIVPASCAAEAVVRRPTQRVIIFARPTTAAAGRTRNGLRRRWIRVAGANATRRGAVQSSGVPIDGSASSHERR